MAPDYTLLLPATGITQQMVLNDTVNTINGLHCKALLMLTTLSSQGAAQWDGKTRRCTALSQSLASQFDLAIWARFCILHIGILSHRVICILLFCNMSKYSLSSRIRCLYLIRMHLIQPQDCQFFWWPGIIWNINITVAHPDISHKNVLWLNKWPCVWPTFWLCTSDIKCIVFTKNKLFVNRHPTH